MKIYDKSESAPQAKPQPPWEGVFPPPQKWEYHSLRLHTSNPLLRSSLNDLGATGWELVSIVPCLDAPGMVVAFLKRRQG